MVPPLAPTVPAGGWDEVAAVGRAVQGDADAFGELYERHVGRIYRHVLYRVGRVEEAEDVAAQVFLNAWRGMARYRVTGAPFVVWLLRIADHLVISSFRRERRWLQAPLGAREVGLRTEEADLEGPLERDGLRQALLALRAEQRRVVVLRFIEELPSAQVARIMGKSEGAVRVLQHRALAELRRIIASDRAVSGAPTPPGQNDGGL